MTPETLHSLYNPEMNLVAETAMDTTAQPGIAYEYIWFNGQPVAQVETATRTVHTYFNDHLGTPVLTTNFSGAVDWQVEREPYGKQYAARTTTLQHQPLAFPGQEEDVSTDADYNVFRWYRNEWGRYSSADPIGIRGGYNLLQYAAFSPVNLADPLGLEIKRCFRNFSNPKTNCLAALAGAFTNWNLYQPPIPGVSLCLMHEYLYNTDTHTSLGFDPKEMVKETGNDFCYTIPEPTGSCVWKKFLSTAGPMANYWTVTVISVVRY